MRRLFFAGFFFFLLTIFATSLVTQGATECPDDFELKGGVCFPLDTGLSDESVVSVLGNFMDWLLAIFGLIAIVAFVISGIQYITAAGDERAAETAKANMKYSIIGIIVALSGYVIIQAIDTALRAGSNF